MAGNSNRRTTTGDRSIPVDLLGVVVLLSLAAAVLVVPQLRESVIRSVVLAPVITFLPGYAVVAALFPRWRREEAAPGPGSEVTETTETWLSEETTDDITGLERWAVSLLANVAIVAFVALAVSVSELPFRSEELFVGTAIITLLGVGVAYRRRRTLSAARRGTVGPKRRLAAAFGGLQLRSLREVVMLIVVISSVAVAAGVVGSTVLSLETGGSTELYVLSENGDELIAGDYPDELVAGDSETLYYGVENRDGETREYTVVVQRHRLESESGAVTAQEELYRQSLTLDHGETARYDHTVEPIQSGDRRLVYLLYRGSPPAEPSMENAYRSVHIEIAVVDSAGAVDSEDG